MAKKKTAVTLSKRCERLFHSHQTIATKVAKLVSKRVPRSVELDDLIQAGQIGLLDAAQRFKPARGVKFGTFALWRVRGAIMDWLRQQDIVPRSIRKRQTKRRMVEQQLMEAGSRVTPEKVKESLAWSEAEYQASIPKFTHSISTLTKEGESKHYQFDAVAPTEDDLRKMERLDGVRGLLRHLSTETFVIIYLYYWRGTKMRHIGEVLGVSESRVSQMHAAGLQRLSEVGEKIRDHI